MTFITRSFDELNAVSIAQLVALGYTDAQYEATGIRSIVEATNTSVAGLYSDVSSDFTTVTLSGAAGSNLDAIGSIVGLSRYAGESDNNYRVRLTMNRQINVLGSLSNIISPLSSLIDVRDVVVKNYIYGIGTIGLFLVGVNGPVSDSTIATATTTAQKFTPAGASIFIQKPKYLTLEVYGTLSPDPSVDTQDTATLQGLASNAIINYISGLSMGDPLITAKIVQAVLNASADIQDFQILSMSITKTGAHSQEILVADYLPEYNEELVAGSILVV